MKLKHFKAEYFRTLRDFEISLEDFVVITGENNVGKSTLFYALDLFFSATVKGVKVDHFHNRDTTKPIILTACFECLSQPETEKLGPWMVGDTLTVSKEYSIDEAGKVSADYYAVMNVPEEAWLSDDYENYSKREIVATFPINEFLPNSGRLTKEAYKQAIDAYKARYSDRIRYRVDKRKNPAGYKQVLDGYLPNYHLVPAVKEATEEAQTGSSTLLGKLLDVVVKRIAQFNPAFQQLKSAIDNIKQAIEGGTTGKKMEEIRELEIGIEKALDIWSVKVEVKVNPPEADKVFQLGTSVELNDGFSSRIEYKGHGLQRSFIFALMRVWASESKKHQVGGTAALRERANIFAFEEPELFLHPQVCRASYEALRELAKQEQIFLCTHSAHFVDLEDYRNIAIVRKASPTEGSKALRVTTDLFERDEEKKKRFDMIRFFNPDRNEVFFARKVILVEGPTEKSLFPLIAKRLGSYDHSVSIIECQGKFNLPLYMKVLNAFKIAYVAIYDEDSIAEDLKPGGARHNPEKYQEAKRAYEQNQQIEAACDRGVGSTRMVKDELEGVLGLSESEIKRMGKPFAAVEKFSDPAVAIPQVVKDLVNEGYKK